MACAAIAKVMVGGQQNDLFQQDVSHNIIQGSVVKWGGGSNKVL